MVRSALVVLIVAVAVLYTCEAREVCRGGEHDVWNDCGSACSPACDSKPDMMCTMACVPKCECKRGFVRNSGGKCIKPNECKKNP